jgi:phosphonopyruvate decarboxylase
MINAERFLKAAKAHDVSFFSGVPCSFLTPLINRVISDADTTYIGATSEGEAVGIAAGAWLAGRGSAMMCQNSGLGNAVNPLTSLNHPFRIPTLLIVTWRAGPGTSDEPQHELMGRITLQLLDLLNIPHRPFPCADADVDGAVDEAMAHMQGTDTPFALIMEKGGLAAEALTPPPANPPPPGHVHDLRTGSEPMSRAQALEKLLEEIPGEAAVIATTGKCGRELFTLGDRPQHLYQVGSMGCASSMGLGVAINTGHTVVVVDGDGAALMKLGSMATIGAHRPRNLVHVLLDNGVHDSTGGQPTVSSSVDFSTVANACGYAEARSCDDLEGFAQALAGAWRGEGPHFIHMRIAPGSIAKLGRPTLAPMTIARRFRDFLADTPCTS